ncbi:MAG: hypothetical protein WAN34_02115 [Acidimicrobiia bacterium]
MTDELREKLARLDPMPPDVPTQSVTTPSSRQLLEDIMSTPVVEKKDPAVPDRSRRWLTAAAAAAVLVLAVGGAFIFNNGGSGSDPVASGPPLTLSAGEGDGMAMCIQFSVELLAPAQIAFEGTVTDIADDQVSLQVDHWYKGGDAGEVVLTAPQGLLGLIGGIDFQTGESYLITATDGVVNYCGFSGSSTPDLKAAFEEAFGA